MMMTPKKGGTLALSALLTALLMSLVLLTGCSHKNKQAEPHDKDDKPGYFEPRVEADNPSDNAAMRHERRGHLRWRP